MRRLIRPFAFLLSLVLLQLVLVESGYACRTPMNAAMGGSAMAGMPMPGSANHSSSAPTQDDQRETPCRFPWAPNGCQAMAPCALSAVTVASTVIVPCTPARVAPAQLVVLAPPALTSAPELPPPRA